MAVKKDERQVKSKKNKEKIVTKVSYKCEGNYVDINGTPHRYHKRGFETSEDAKSWERLFLAKAKNEVSNDLNFNDLFILYMENKKDKIKERSRLDITYLYDSRIKADWGEIKLSKITKKHISSYTSKLLGLTYKKNDSDFFYSNSYLESIQSLLKATIRFGMQEGYITDLNLDKWSLVKRANFRKEEMDFWTPKEYEKFIKEVDDVTYYALFNVLYWCGLRLGEVLALTWSDIDFEENFISVNKTYSKKTRLTTTPKTSNSYRQVLMTEKCKNALECLFSVHKSTIGYNNSKLVFGFNKHMDENTIRRYKDICIKKANIKRIRIHDFRHSHVSLLINNGFSSFDIAKRLGHTVNMVNETYGHLFKEAQENMIKKLNML